MTVNGRYQVYIAPRGGCFIRDTARHGQRRSRAIPRHRAILLATYLNERAAR